MASRVSLKKGVVMDPKEFHSRLADQVLLALSKHVPFRNYGRVQHPSKGFYKLASRTFARVVSQYHFFSLWDKGRGPVSRPRNKPMVFFPNIKDDPRVKDDYPRTPGKRRSLRTLLSDEEFKRMRKDGTLIVTTKTAKVAPEYFTDTVLKEARQGIRSTGIAQIQKGAQSIIKQVRSARGLTYFTLM